MDFIGGVENMKFSPISNYNNYLKTNMSFDVDSNMDFESILSKQTAQLQNSQPVQGGVQLNNFEDVLAKSAIQSTEQSSGNFLDSFGKSVSSGLHNANNSVVAAEKAQEEFAMGGNVSVHDVMISAEKASLNMAMTMQLRNKLITAYNEINAVRV